MVFEVGREPMAQQDSAIGNGLGTPVLSSSDLDAADRAELDEYRQEFDRSTQGVGPTELIQSMGGIQARALDSNLTSIPLDLREITASMVALALWLVFLSGGIAVGAQNYIDPIRNQTVLSIWQLIGCGIMIVTCHTVPNTAMLCCLSAFLGVIGSRAIGVKSRTATASVDRWGAYVAAVTRGFFVFLIIQSGTIILSDQAFTNLSLEKYIRLAGLASLFSFSVGFNPGLFWSLIDRVNYFAANQSNTANGPTR